MNSKPQKLAQASDANCSGNANGTACSHDVTPSSSPEAAFTPAEAGRSQARRWRRRHGHGGCCCEGGSSVGLQVRIGAEHGVVISHGFGQQIFLMDVLLAVHIYISAQLQELIHLHFAEDWQHCRLFWRVALHRCRWVARSAAAAPGAALPGRDWRQSIPRSALALGVCLASSARIVGSHSRMQQRWP